MNDKNKNLKVRIGTALVALPVVLYMLYLGGWATGALLGFAAMVCAWEYMEITFRLKWPTPIVTFVGLLAGLMPLLPVWRPVEAPALAIGLIGVVLFAAWMWHLVKGPHEDATVRVGNLLTAFVYGSGGLTALVAVRQFPETGGYWLFALLLITWGNDTSAYFVGRAIGRHKLYPAISPNKTWEGFFGGMAGGVGLLFVMRAYMFPAMSPVDCVVLGVLGGIFGPAGDFCESMLKRQYGVKDSGGLLPGHGGMLDRLDALIFNSPMVLLYVQFGRPLLGL